MKIDKGETVGWLPTSLSNSNGQSMHSTSWTTLKSETSSFVIPNALYLTRLMALLGVLWTQREGLPARRKVVYPASFIERYACEDSWRSHDCIEWVVWGVRRAMVRWACLSFFICYMIESNSVYWNARDSREENALWLAKVLKSIKISRGWAARRLSEWQGSFLVRKRCKSLSIQYRPGKLA